MPPAERREPDLARHCRTPAPTPRTASRPAISRNEPFTIDDYIAADDKTCPAPGVSAPQRRPRRTPRAPLPGGCTRDLVHRFYQEQYQINGGQQNRYVTGSDAVGLTMGHYDTKQLPIYQYLHSHGRTALRRSPTTSSRARSAARSSTTSA